MNSLDSRLVRIRHVAGAERPPSVQYDADVVIHRPSIAPRKPWPRSVSALGQTGVSSPRHRRGPGLSPRCVGAHSVAEAVHDRDDATLVALDRNLGVPGGRNLGTILGHGRSPSPVWTTTLIFGSPDTLARMVAAVDADPDLCALGCRIVVDATDTDDLSSWGYPTALLARSRETFESATFVGAGHAIRRETWDDTGGYDPRKVVLLLGGI